MTPSQRLKCAAIVAVSYLLTGQCPSTSPLVVADVRAPLPALRGDAARAELNRRGLTTSLGAAIESARYSARPSDDAAQTYVVQNPAQGLRGVFAQDRAVVMAGGRQVTLRSVGVGFGRAEQPMAVGTVKADGNRTEITRTLRGVSGEAVRVDEWWVNGNRTRVHDPRAARRFSADVGPTELRATSVAEGASSLRRRNQFPAL